MTSLEAKTHKEGRHLNCPQEEDWEDFLTKTQEMKAQGSREIEFTSLEVSCDVMDTYRHQMAEKAEAWPL